MTNQRFRTIRRNTGLCALAVGAFVALSSGLIAGEPSTSSGSAAKQVTFAKDIAPIFQEKCEVCHRKDSMAPMSLVTYQETRP